MPHGVALVVGQLQMGGAERQLFELAVRLDRSRYDPLVVCLSEVSEPFATRLRERGVPVEVLARSGHRDFGRLLELGRILRRDDIRGAHSFLLAANAYTWAASRLARRQGRALPFIASSRTCIPARGLWARRIHQRAFRSAAAVIANSRRVMEFTRDLYGIEERRIRVIPNGVDLSGFEPVVEDARAVARAKLGLKRASVVVGSVGRLSPEKNPGLFAEMAARLPVPVEGLDFVLVGEGPEMPALRAQAARAGFADRFVFAGAREDVARVLPAFDIFVSASNTEGMPNAVMEAMAAGLPVVATRVGGSDEVVEEGRTGYLVDRGDLEALVKQTGRLIVDARMRHLMGASGRERIEHEFPVQRMVASTAALYDEVLR